MPWMTWVDDPKPMTKSELALFEEIMEMIERRTLRTIPEQS